jgi:hypothetical protein
MTNRAQHRHSAPPVAGEQQMIRPHRHAHRAAPQAASSPALLVVARALARQAAAEMAKAFSDPAAAPEEIQ